jgi:putative DNA primase/helicase
VAEHAAEHRGNRGAIPAELRHESRWLVWRAEERDGKRTKVPYRADNPAVRASSTDPATWADFDVAHAVVEAGRATGLGFALPRAEEAGRSA